MAALRQDPIAEEAFRAENAARSRKSYQKNPSAPSQRQRKKKYGITPEDFDALRDSQRDECAICGVKFQSTSEMFVDHCHKTGVVRGLLCCRCNSGLGMFVDNKDNLLAAVRYLEAVRVLDRS